MGSGVPLAALPTELHICISRHLNYPDALSLKHSSQHFYGLVDTGVRLKVAWLIERKQLQLECPVESGQTVLRSDEAFCRSPKVRKLIERRRRHLECGRGRGCVVVVGGPGGCARSSWGSRLGRVWRDWAQWFWEHAYGWDLALAAASAVLGIAVYLAGGTLLGWRR